MSAPRIVPLTERDRRDAQLAEEVAACRASLRAAIAARDLEAARFAAVQLRIALNEQELPV